MHHIINGIKVECTPEEEESIKLEWESNRLKQQAAKAEELKIQEMKKTVLEKLKTVAGLTDEEIKTLF